MAQLRYYTSHAVDHLRHEVAASLDWYYSPNGPPPADSVSADIRESRLEAPALADKLVMDARPPSETDADNALIVYEALAELTPHQASMERLWAYLCHRDCPEYVAARWLNRRPASDDDAVREVRNHFFAVGNRALIRDNAVSRLWWLGKIAHEAAADDPGEFLEILLHRQDVRSALIERPSVSMNRRVLRIIYGVMKEYWASDRTLFEREAFRRWMVALNRSGGVVLLDAMPDDDLRLLVSQEAKAALVG